MWSCSIWTCACQRAQLRDFDFFFFNFNLPQRLHLNYLDMSFLIIKPLWLGSITKDKFKDVYNS